MTKIEFDFSTLSLPIKKGQWRDADERMFLACFAILGQYVEDELGSEPWPDNAEAMYRGYRRHAADDGDEKAIDLWLWYTQELPALEADYNRDLEECYSGGLEFRDAGNGAREIVPRMTRRPKYPYGHIEAVKEDKLQQLMALRRRLWT